MHVFSPDKYIPLSFSHFFLGYSNIALCGPIYVAAAHFHDEPSHTADESPVPG